jgi:hypothetical protein
MQSRAAEAAAKDSPGDIFEELVNTALQSSSSATQLRDLSPHLRSTHIWSLGGRAELPPPPLKRLPRNPISSTEGAHDLSEMLGPRPKQKTAHVEAISVDKLGKNPKQMTKVGPSLVLLCMGICLSRLRKETPVLDLGDCDVPRFVVGC